MTNLFVKLEGNSLIAIFWNCIIIGFFLLPIGVNPSTPFFIMAIILGSIGIVKNKTMVGPIDLTYLSFPILFLVMTVSLGYSENIKYGFKLIERSVPLLFFPIILMYIKEDKNIVRKIFNALILGITVSFIINLILATSSSLIFENHKLVFDPSKEGGYSFMESFSHGGSKFIGGEFSKYVHPSYISMYIIASIIFIHKHYVGKIKVLLTCILVVFLFLLASRGAFVILISIVSIYLLNVKGFVAKLKRLVLMGVIGLLFFSFNPRLRIFYDRIQDFTTKENFNYTTSEQSRILIYLSSLRLIKESPTFGYGIGDADNILLNDYIDLGYLTNARNEYNAHNQYFQTLLQVGIPGILLLIFPFAVILYRTTNLQTVLITVVLLGSLLFESMLVRYNGVIFFSIIVPILMRKNEYFD